MESQTKIYQGIICLEIPSSNGAKWWLQGYNTSYSPFPISAVKEIAKGRIKATNKAIFATPIDISGAPKLITINMQRSDVWTLIKKGFIPKDTPLPRSIPNYSKSPEKL